MQYTARKITPYALAGMALLSLLTGCGAKPTPALQTAPTPQYAEFRLMGSVDCRGSAQPDILGNVRNVLNNELKDVRLKGMPSYERMDIVITGPPVDGYDRIVAYNIGLSGPLAPERDAALKDALAKACLE